MAPARPPAAAIVGIGATEFSKDSGRSELRLAAEAVRAALDDAALTPADVDGLVTFTMDSNAEIPLAPELGVPGLSFFGPARSPARATRAPPPLGPHPRVPPRGGPPAPRPAPAGGGPPLHARLRRAQRGLRPGAGGGPPSRRDQPARLVLPAPGHARRASGLALDRRTP